MASDRLDCYRDRFRLQVFTLNPPRGRRDALLGRQYSLLNQPAHRHDADAQDGSRLLHVTEGPLDTLRIEYRDPMIVS